MFFHIYGIVAFLSVLITYFGVNLILGGMHSYAS
jgi:ABC-type transport system involved in cytochrome c biogenesis permease subunit